MESTRHRLALLALGLAPLLALASGCTPSIGDSCVLSTDCSVRGDRVCDNAQSGGYCTVFNCVGNSCPDEATCVLFGSAVQGCGYDDRVGPARTARTVCMKTCTEDSDCRDGYVCASPRQAPWAALILDDDQTRRVCIVRPTVSRATSNTSVPDPASAPVCRSDGPDAAAIDASPSRPDAGADASNDAPASEAGPDGGTSDGGTGGDDGGATDASGGG